jgi:hypothetical protein
MAAAWTACTKLRFAKKRRNPGARRLAPGFAFLRAFLKGVLEKVVFWGGFFVVKLW